MSEKNKSAMDEALKLIADGLTALNKREEKRDQEKKEAIQEAEEEKKKEKEWGVKYVETMKRDLEEKERKRKEEEDIRKIAWDTVGHWHLNKRRQTFRNLCSILPWALAGILVVSLVVVLFLF